MINFKRYFLLSNFLLITIITFGQKELIHNRDENSYVKMSEVLTEFQDLGMIGPEYNNSVDYNITLNNFGYLLLVKYLGEIRKIDKNKKNIIVNSFKSFGYGKEADELFKQEVYIETDSGCFWIPIQDQLLNFWKEELKTNDSVLIYIRIHAAFDTDAENKWLFVINSFNSNILDGLWEEALSNFGKPNELIGLRCINDLIKLYPKDGRNYAMLAFYYTNSGNNILDNDIKAKYFNKSDSLFKISMQLTPDYSYQYFQKAILNFHRGDYFNTWKMIDKARELKDEHVEEQFIEDLENKLSYSDYLKQMKNKL